MKKNLNWPSTPCKTPSTPSKTPSTPTKIPNRQTKRLSMINKTLITPRKNQVRQQNIKYENQNTKYANQKFTLFCREAIFVANLRTFLAYFLEAKKYGGVPKRTNIRYAMECLTKGYFRLTETNKCFLCKNRIFAVLPLRWLQTFRVSSNFWGFGVGLLCVFRMDHVCKLWAFLEYGLVDFVSMGLT